MVKQQFSHIKNVEISMDRQKDTYMYEQPFIGRSDIMIKMYKLIKRDGQIDLNKGFNMSKLCYSYIYSYI